MTKIDYPTMWALRAQLKKALVSPGVQAEGLRDAHDSIDKLISAYEEDLIDYIGRTTGAESEPGVIYLFDDGLHYYATPGWDGELLPFNVTDADGSNVYATGQIKVMWTGDLEADCETWMEKVSALSALVGRSMGGSV